MPDLEISKLPELPAGGVAETDPLAIADLSASETKKISVRDLFAAGIETLPDGSISGDQIEDGTISGDKLEPGVIPEKTSDLTNDGENGVDPFITQADVDATLTDGGYLKSGDNVSELVNDAGYLVDTDLDGYLQSGDNISELVNDAGYITDAGVTEITAGTNITITPDPGVGSVEISADFSLEPDSVGQDELADGSVGTDQLIDGSVTNDKLAGDISGDKLLDGTITADKLGAVTDRGLDQTTGNIGITNDTGADSTTQNGITYDRQGLITDSTPLTGADLPPATDTEIGGVIPGTGLEIDPDGVLNHSNSVTGGTAHGISFDDEGHITGFDEDATLNPDSLPPAGTTAAELGAVYVPVDTVVGIRVNSTSGELVHEVSPVVAGTYPKVEIDSNGHVIAGFSQIDESELPDSISIDKLTGTIGTDQLEDCCITGPKICDYATCLMQEDNPGAGDFLGQFWYTPSTAQLRVYARGSGPENIWLPVGFGALQANNLRWGGTYDADSDTLVSLTAIGVSEGLTPGQSFPAPTDQMSGLYFICQVAGNNCSQPNINGINHTAGDWALCIDQAQGWVHIDANAGGGGGGGGGAQYLDDLLDVTIGGQSGPFSDQPKLTLSNEQILKYDGGMGQWRNTDMINGGTF